MASLCAMLTKCKPHGSFFVHLKTWFAPHTRSKSTIKLFSSAAVVFVHCQARNVDVQTVGVKKLKQEKVLQGAAEQNLEAVSIMLSQTSQALLQAEEKYRQTVQRVMNLLEHHLTVLEQKEEEERVWDILMQGRDRLHVCHQHLQELLLLFSFVEKMTMASGEVALLTGSEGGSSHLQQQLTKAQEQLKTAQEQRVHIDQQLQTLQAHSVQVIAEHAEKEKRKKQREKEGR